MRYFLWKLELVLNTLWLAAAIHTQWRMQAAVDVEGVTSYTLSPKWLKKTVSLLVV